MSSKLEAILFGNGYERNSVESMQLGGIICPMIRLHHYQLYIYGCGQKINSLILYLWKNRVEIKGIIDRDASKAGTLILDKVPVIHTSELRLIKDPEDVFVLINTVFFDGLGQSEIVNTLYSVGITKFYSLHGKEKNEIDLYAPVTGGALQFYRDHINQLEQVYHMLFDDASKEIFLEIIRAKVECGVYRLPQCEGRYKYFYGNYIPSSDSYEELYSHLKNEIWINCGSNIGDSIFLYFAAGLSAEKIYAFEGDKGIYKQLCGNLTYLPDTFRQHVIPINQFIDDHTDFSKLLGETRITLINADIEGYELNMLKNMESLIRHNRPVIAVCAYHKKEDLIELPSFISSLGNYHLLFRKYEAGIGCLTRTDELVLYGIPCERLTDTKREGGCNS